jgi:hypothetical protein
MGSLATSFPSLAKGGPTPEGWGAGGVHSLRVEAAQERARFSVGWGTDSEHTDIKPFVHFRVVYFVNPGVVSRIWARMRQLDQSVPENPSVVLAA